MGKKKRSHVKGKAITGWTRGTALQTRKEYAAPPGKVVKASQPRSNVYYETVITRKGVS